MLNVSNLLEQIKQNPYREITVYAPHTGVVTFENIKPGDEVHGPEGQWKEKPGTKLATLTRERNPKPIYAFEKGVIDKVHTEYENAFVESGCPLVTIRHHLTREEVESIILKQALFLFRAPERAKYYFTPEVAAKLRASDFGSVVIHDGQELFIMSRMKRELPLYYMGPEGVIYATYFKPNDNVDTDAPLIGVCPQEELPNIKEVIMRVQTEWQEK
ncbi:MAG: biotin attachment protein [Desulfovibrionaceae bacterium]|nr:biotin attachment protein [Desulfovibrionaceae bacterium]